MKHDQIEAIAAVLRDSPRLTEIEVRNPETGLSLRLRRAPARPVAPVASPPPPVATDALSSVALVSGAFGAANEAKGAVENLPTSPTLATGPKVSVATAGLVGVFRPVESRPIGVGDAVQIGQVLGYIESMRLMNECSAPVSGTVSALLVTDGQPVEYGQPLFDVSPLVGGEEL